MSLSPHCPSPGAGPLPSLCQRLHLSRGGVSTIPRRFGGSWNHQWKDRWEDARRPQSSPGCTERGGGSGPTREAGWRGRGAVGGGVGKGKGGVGAAGGSRFEGLPIQHTPKTHTGKASGLRHVELGAYASPCLGPSALAPPGPALSAPSRHGRPPTAPPPCCSVRLEPGGLSWLCGPSWFCGCTSERAFTSGMHRDHWTPSFPRERGWGAGAATPGWSAGHTPACRPAPGKRAYGLGAHTGEPRAARLVPAAVS